MVDVDAVAGRLEALGLAVYPMAFALVLIANLTPIAPVGDPVLESVFLPIHTTLAFFGYAALFVAFAGGILYLIGAAALGAMSFGTGVGT